MRTAPTRLRGLAALALTALLTGAFPVSGASLGTGETGPNVELLYNRATIFWEIWGEEGSRITGCDLYLNGRRVPAIYDTVERRVAYTPERPLPAGRYHASARVTLDSTHEVSEEWNFSVSPKAMSDLPTPSSAQIDGWLQANAFRRLMGLPDFILDPHLSAAAQHHTEYSKRHGSGHGETPGTPGFTGVSPWDRAKTFGGRAGSEDMSFGIRSPAAAVSGLIDAPYHRLPFMRPGIGRFGIGYQDGTTTLDFADGSGEGIVVYPVDGQLNIPRAFRGGENPDPRRVHGLSGATGYIVAYLHSSKGDSSIRYLGASLVTRSGVPVPIVVNWAANDNAIGSGGVFIIPVKPLVGGNRYTASVTARNALGQDISRTWSFTTSNATSSADTALAVEKPASGLMADAKRDMSNSNVSVWLRNADHAGERHVAVRLRDAAGKLLTTAYVSVPAGSRRALSLKARAAAVADIVDVDAVEETERNKLTIAVRAPIGPTKITAKPQPRTKTKSAHKKSSRRAKRR